jgi:hypothetical protein
MKTYVPPSSPVRLRIEVEELVETVAEQMNLDIPTVRNLAVLIGLQFLCSTHITQKKPFVTLDDQFKELLEYTQKVVRMYVETKKEREEQLEKVVVHG